MVQIVEEHSIKLLGHRDKHLEGFLSQFWNEEDCVLREGMFEFLRPFVKGKGKSLNSILDKFSFRFQVDSLRGGKNKFIEVNLSDAQYDFCLCCDMEKLIFDYYSLCGLSFDIIESGIFIRQIQGSRNYDYCCAGGEERKDILSRLEWEKALVSYLVNIFNSFNVPIVKLQGVRNNKWVKKSYDALKGKLGERFPMSYNEFLYLSNDLVREYKNQAEVEGLKRGEIHLLPMRGRKHYDEIALSLGFVSDDQGDYVLNLK